VTDRETIDLIDRSIADEFELDRSVMTPDKALFADLGLDSLDIVDLVIVLEGAFKFKIRDEEGVRGIRTLGDIHAFILRKKAAVEGAAP
jgi:acyl carrier protein